MPDIEDREAPVVVHASASVPRLGAAVGGGLSLPLAVREADFARTYARLSTRKQDLVLAYPWQHDEELVYKLPAGWSLLAAPDKREVASPFGRLTVEVTSEPGGVVRVHTFLDVARFRIPPGEYAAFRAFLGDIDSALAERVVVGPGGGAS
jgi:hypothetical protein